jgi:citrate lyase subunit beta/citryl-CoA lyase
MPHKLIPAMLFVPGDMEAKLEKIWSLDSPAFVLDLEDAVATSHKAMARELVATQLDRAAKERSDKLYVRVNGVSTSHGLADLLAIVRPGLPGIVVPKVSCAAELQKLDWVIAQLESERGLPPGEIGYIGLLENARGIHNAMDIAHASPRLMCLTFGAGDMSADLGVDVRDVDAIPQRSALINALKTQVVLASSAAGLAPPHESVHTDFRDLDGLRRSSEVAREIGFFGRHAIHPAQIPVIEEVFAPREEEVAWAERIVSEFAESEAAGSAAILVADEFVDYAIAVRAQRILALAGRAVELPAA